MKLHLGCGQIYLKGYVNIDFPSQFHTVQSSVKADLYQDITMLKYKTNSILEIRSHHLFEHFSRVLALAQLCKWRDWLKPGGLLRIETPDFLSSINLFHSSSLSYSQKQQVIRHVFGSHEASWAVHWDGWYKEKFTVTLQNLGFQKLKFIYTRWGVLRNIEVLAYKSSEIFDFVKYKTIVTDLLMDSTIKVHTRDKYIPEGSEAIMLNVWLDKWITAYRE